MAKISACVISFNEEDKIEDCLASLDGLADEIVVVDSRSTDRTREIAEKYADRVVEQDFLGYVGQSNFAMSLARHDWILALDCDERLSPELQSELHAEKRHLGRCDAYEMPRRTFYVDRWMDHCWYPDRRIRLFDRRRGRWVGREPHSSVKMEGGRVVRLQGDILHYSFDTVSDHLRTIDRFSEAAARSLHADGHRVTFLAPIVHGLSTFVAMYVVKRGFLDGFGGLVVSVLSGAATFTKYAKLRYLSRSGAPGSDS